MNLLKRFKAWRDRRKIIDVQEFAHRHRNYLVIVCDPKDDTMFSSYLGKQVSVKMKSEDGVNHHIIKNMLKHSTFEREIDRFIGGLVFGLKISLEVGTNFYLAVGKEICAIANSLKKQKTPYATPQE